MKYTAAVICIVVIAASLIGLRTRTATNMIALDNFSDNQFISLNPKQSELEVRINEVLHENRWIQLRRPELPLPWSNITMLRSFRQCQALSNQEWMEGFSAKEPDPSPTGHITRIISWEPGTKTKKG